jgi:antirestriction protein ArdC
MKRADLFNSLIAKITQKLSEGVLPWRKSWSSGVPVNYISKRPYNGINFVALSLNEYPSPYYLTYLQCKEKNGLVRKGENGSPIIYWNLLEEKGEKDSPPEKMPFVKVSYVFNLSQTSLYDIDKPKPLNYECESLIAGMKEQPIVQNNISRCYYNVLYDYISLPDISGFDSPAEYYSSLFHELIHWTGHKSRLNRNLVWTDKEEDAVEELIAEIGSSYLCSICGLEPMVIENQASYIESWLKLIKEKETSFIKAVTLSRQSVGYILQDNSYSFERINPMSVETE